MADLEYMVPQTAAEIEHRLSYPVLYEPQELSAAKKAQARMNIGAASEDINGFEVVGYFDTLEDLEAAVTEPKAGPFYGVGTEPPLKYYSWDEMHSIWADNGGIKGVDGAPGKDGADGKDGKDAVITPESIASGLGYTPGMVNPNLLDNWYFANPVNQRGEANYSTTTGWNGIYSVDRWKITLGTFDVPTGTFIPSIVGGRMGQLKENPAMLSNQVVTLSYLGRGGAGVWLSVLVDGTHVGQIELPNERECSALTMQLPTINTRLEVRIRSETVGEGFTIEAIKLELGSVQTLAHQDADGNWVLNELPDYGEQLARCQRYCRRYASDNVYAAIAIGTYRNTTSASFLINASMRTAPAIAYGPNMYVYTPGSNGIAVTAMQIVSWEQGAIYFEADFVESSLAAQGKTAILGAAGTATWLELSADL